MMPSHPARPRLLLAVLLAGCAPAAAPGPLTLPDRYHVEFRRDIPPHRSVVPAPLEEVESLVPGVYEFLGLGVQRARGAPHLWITPHLRVQGVLYEGEKTSDYINCGEGAYGARADLYEVQFAMFTELTEAGPSSTVVRSALEGWARSKVHSEAVPCRGTGRLEEQVATLLRQRAARAAARPEPVRPAPVRPAPESIPVPTRPHVVVVLEEQSSGTDALLQAVSAVDTSVVWVSGHGGTWGRTTDGGRTWRTGVVPGADSLEFRDVHALDAGTAWLLAAGPGARSRIYHTRDGGGHWTLQWTNPEPAGFYDCLDFWDGERGFVYGDAVAGELRVLVTGDGGATWTRAAPSGLPPARPGEGGFAASGLCAEAGPDGRGWIATGNGDTARVLRTVDWGRTWTAHATPMVAGSGAGLTAISMADGREGFAFGGDIGGQVAADSVPMPVLRTRDGGESWDEVGRLPFAGPAYGGVAVVGTYGHGVVAVGPGGAGLSVRRGGAMHRFDDRSWWAVGSAAPWAIWIVGPEGRIARVVRY